MKQFINQGQGTHIYFVRRKTIIWTNAGLLVIGPWGTHADKHEPEYNNCFRPFFFSLSVLRWSQRNQSADQLPHVTVLMNGWAQGTRRNNNWCVAMPFIDAWSQCSQYQCDNSMLLYTWQAYHLKRQIVFRSLRPGGVYIPQLMDCHWVKQWLLNQRSINLDNSHGQRMAICFGLDLLIPLFAI